LHFFD